MDLRQSHRFEGSLCAPQDPLWKAISTITVTSRTTDVYQSPRLTVDVGSSYELTKRVQVFFNLKNLTNAPVRFYEGEANRPMQREFYDRTAEAGVKLHV